MFTRNDVLDYVKNTFSTNPEYLWKNDNVSAVLRNTNGGKWYGILMRVNPDKLGIQKQTNKPCDILNVKCDKLMLGSLLLQEGFYPAYHMSKTSWVTILLDEKTSAEQVEFLINSSYTLTSKKEKKKNNSSENSERVPADTDEAMKLANELCERDKEVYEALAKY